MKKITLLFLIFLAISCSSDDEATTANINVNLLFGKWYEVNRCAVQNNLELNANYTYTHLKSGNITCAINDAPTYQYTGTYSINGNQIVFNQQNAVLMQDADVPVVLIPSLDVLLYSKITILNDNNLFIERKYNGTQEYFNNWSFTK